MPKSARRSTFSTSMRARRCALLPSTTPIQFPGERNELHYIPLGVGAVIPPWNFSLAIMAGMTVAAVVTGNTVILKPSSDAPTVAARFFSLLEEAGLPPGVVEFLSRVGRDFWKRASSSTRRHVSLRSPGRRTWGSTSMPAPRKLSRARYGSSGRSSKWAARIRSLLSRTATSTQL